MGPEKGIEHLVYLVFIEEIIRVIESDKQHDLLFDQDAGNGIKHLLKGCAG